MERGALNSNLRNQFPGAGISLTTTAIPELQLAQRLLSARGVDTLILAPAELEYANVELTASGQRIDMVYNRLVDFALEAPHHAALRRAYLEGDYIAQDLVPPGERGLRIDDKVTTGGGFAPIFQV